MTRTADAAKTERWLRRFLGLPKLDGRRIVPISRLSVEKASPNWVTVYTNMLEKHPDVAHAILMLDDSDQKAFTAELSRMISTIETARQGHEPPNSTQHLFNHDFNRFITKHPNLKHIIDQKTESCSRAFLEVHAAFRQFETASEIQTAAAKRLEAVRTPYNEGRIAVDRFLDAVSQHASAVAQEAQYKTAYNVSLIALAEAQGTLLELKQLTVVGVPEAAKAVRARRDEAATLARHEPLSAIPTPAPTTAQPPPIAPSQQPPDLGRASPAKANDLKGADAGKSFSFEFTVPISPQPVTIRGSFSVAPAPASETSKAP